MEAAKTYVYGLRVGAGRPMLRILSIATRRPISHDAAQSFDFIPDIFFPVSAAGSAVALWSARVTPIMAMGRMAETSLFAAEDIDHIPVITADREEEARQDALNEAFAKLLHELVARADHPGQHKEPFPAAMAAKRARAKHMAEAILRRAQQARDAAGQ